MGTFSLLYVSGTCLNLLLYGLKLVSFWYYTSSVWSSEVLMVWDVFHIEYYTGFGTVCQVGGTLQMYLRSFEVEEKP